MKFSALATVALSQVASAHYFFDKTFVDGVQVGQPLEYIRKNTRSIAYMPTKWINSFDNLTPDDPDFRCNLGAFKSAKNTKVLEVKPGDKIGMGLGVQATMRHPGPCSAHMSKAPGSVQDYEGDGEWFKIHEEGICDKTKDIKGPAWCTWDKDRVEFTIPAGTPNGEYLIRSEHIGLHGAHDRQAEFYYGCLQVKVTGGGNGTPGPTYKFPGAYKKDDPEFNFSVWGGMKDYKMHGPRPWTGGNGGNGGNDGSDGNSTTPIKEATSPATSSAASPVPVAPSATASASPSPISEDPTQLPPVHNSENCNGEKYKRGRRAFRDTILRA
ncbi:hypothetical protein CFE70_002896 [Pyrenophora teres f. teres 0-1]|uniref:AA9 family lytic polysaccharide monooxygenase n=1 Tax=Pyrenophora teres f. teres (strain 0-1) TaxID=861557 RepID=E3RPM0_PYRTT|nr:hypothetical protein PTT_10600 [Pyrenophora teres f. teres 0-1]KAE8853096.1 hypothetical protein HRS9122_00088 [Pyrenophora teres f. teres]KAE8855483.1 hypothetical protein PTNB73_10140 [Pyrenophora teres f. teres]